MEGTMSDAIKDAVREKYSQAAVRVGSSCCGEAACGGSAITANLYADAETGGLPQAAVLASLGCGNPTARPARRCSISARAAASTCCCRRGGSARLARSTAST
jgi:hypothetical protein